MDEVLCNFLEKLCKDYNALHNADLTPDKIDLYDLTNFIGSEGKKLFLKADFFNNLDPFSNAISVIKKLHEDDHEIVIVTNALGNPDVAADKCRWMIKYLPFIYPDNFIIAVKKHLIYGDLMFDDSPYVINNFSGIKVVMDRPYNQEVQGYRIYNNNWLDFYSLIKSFGRQ